MSSSDSARGDDEVGESNEKNVGSFFSKRKFTVEKVQLPKSKKKATRHDSVNDRRSKALCTDQNNSPMEKPNLSSAAIICPAPICRQFWKAGEYDDEQTFKVTTQNGKNHLRIHPMFLHSNATSHKWVFGAIAELLDNAVDEIQNGATFVAIDKILNPRDGSSALLIQDDGGGMGPEDIRRCLSFGYSDKKMKLTIGQYGNGFKTSSMRLGADVIVFSRHTRKRTRTQSVGLLSYTFLRQTGYDKIVVPMMDYKYKASSKTYEPIFPHGEESFSSNLSTLLQWSPYLTEEELLKQFDDIGTHGTKVVAYNLWLKDDGDMELDFDSNPEDIRIQGDSKLFQTHSHSDPVKDQHLANMYRYSLRAYSSILYLRIPDNFRIILRGKTVEHRNIADDFIYPEFVLYRPNLGASVEAEVITTIGFWKQAPFVNFNGFNIYHRNRLIMPLWSVLKCNSGNVGAGVVGVLEANFIEPTHNKQDFEKTSLLQKLERRLGDMAFEYWHLHCALIGHKPTKKIPQAYQGLSSMTSSMQEPVLMNNNSLGTDGSKAAHYDKGFGPESNVESEHNRLAKHSRTTRHTESVTYSADEKHREAAQLTSTTEKRSQDQEKMSLLKERKNLQSRLSDIEKSEKKLNLKMQRLRDELNGVQCTYIKLYVECKSINRTKEDKIVNELFQKEKFLSVT